MESQSRLLDDRNQEIHQGTQIVQNKFREDSYKLESRPTMWIKNKRATFSGTLCFSLKQLCFKCSSFKILWTEVAEVRSCQLLFCTAVCVGWLSCEKHRPTAKYVFLSCYIFDDFGLIFFFFPLASFHFSWICLLNLELVWFIFIVCCWKSLSPHFIPFIPWLWCADLPQTEVGNI